MEYLSFIDCVDDEVSSTTLTHVLGRFDPHQTTLSQAMLLSPFQEAVGPFPSSTSPVKATTV